MVNLKDKIVLITGSTSGIGRACAFQFGKLGAKIALTGRDEDKLKNLKNELLEKNINVNFFVCDLLELESIAQLVSEIESYYKENVDILINSAGIAVLGLVENVSLSSLKENFQLNFFASFLLSKLLIPGMRKKGFGQIINLSSGVGKRGLPGASSYSASKFALNGFSESLRVELMKDNIDVIVFSPGLVETNFASNIILHGALKNKFTEGKSLKPNIVAAKIVTASQKRKREVTLSIKTKLGIYLNFFFPRLLDKYLFRQL